MPLVSRTRATLRSAAFGFFGVWVYTRVQTPRFCGQDCSAGLAVLYFGAVRPLRTSWLNVGTVCSSFVRPASSDWHSLSKLSAALGRTTCAESAAAHKVYPSLGGLGSHLLPILPRQAPKPGNVSFRSD